MPPLRPLLEPVAGEIEGFVKVLVTGGAGYIGSVVTAQLIDAGHDVVVYDNLSKGHRDAVHPQAQLVVADINERRALDRVFREHAIDAVLHFAAFIEAGESMQAPGRYFRNNSAHALTLLEAMAAHQVQSLVFSSTAALYGEPLSTPIREDAALEPTNAYGESKLLVERMLRWFHRIHGVRYASLRYFNAAGATQFLGEDHQPETHLIPLVLQVAMQRRSGLAIYGTDYDTPDGSCVRDYVHVSDLAAAHLLALDRLVNQKPDEPMIYNLGSGCGTSVLELAEVARRVTGCEIPATRVARRPGDPAILVASCDKIRTELGWQPRYCDIESIVASAWAWHCEHPYGYRDREPRRPAG